LLSAAGLELFTFRASSAIALKRAGQFTLGAFVELGVVLRQYLRIDRTILTILVVFIALMAVSSTRQLESPQLLAAFVDDEPWLSLALEGMLEKPYGNPSNYLDPTAPAHAHIPEHWGYLRYDGIIYYGGAYFEVAFPFYAALRALGLPAFPTSTIILRLTTALASALSLLFLYNIGVQHGTRLGAVLAVLFLFVDNYFERFSVMAHPDTLQMFFGLLALGMAIRHSERGDLNSLVALGLACGFTQGTKVGGPWTVPMALLALWWGLTEVSRVRANSVEIIKRLALLGVAALGGWIITMPYAFVDPYYFRTMLGQWSWQGATAAADGPFGRVTMGLWAKYIVEYFGPTAMALFALASARIIWLWVRGRANRPFTLALVVCVSQFLFYGTGKGWIWVYYLLLATGLGILLSFDMLAAAASYVQRLLARFPGSAITSLLPKAALICASLILFIPQATSFMWELLAYQTAALSTAVSLNRWAKEHLSPDETILFDNYAFFDARFFKQVAKTTPLSWTRVRMNDPDLLVLAECITESGWYRPLMQSQHLDRNDPNPASVRLYQDLFATQRYGPTPFQGIEYVARIEPQIPTTSESSQIKSLRVTASTIEVFANRWLEFLPEAVRERLLNLAQQPTHWITISQLWARISHPPDQPSEGCGYRVYRINPQGGLFGRPGLLASSSSPNHPARLALDQSPAYWEAAESDLDPYIGYDFGDKNAVVLRTLRVQWRYGPSTPHDVKVEWSDDGTNWGTTSDFTLLPYSSTDPPFRVDTIPIAEQSAHRFWRLVALDRPTQPFAISELFFGSDTEASYR
jgi:F5/8 type C domain